MGLFGAVAGVSLHATFTTTKVQPPRPFIGDAVIEDEGELRLAAQSATDLVGILRGRQDSTLVHFRKLASQPTWQPPSGPWISIVNRRPDRRIRPAQRR